MGLGVTFLLVLVIFFVVAFFVLARVFRAAASRNPNRPDAEGDEGTGATRARGRPPC